jgi:nucleoside-diphosphate-sugar epimerase
VQWVSEGLPVRVNGDGEQSRGFTYVDDIARGTILALKPVGYEVINLGGHEVITINNLIKLIEDVVGKQAHVQHGPPNPADMFTNWADVTKAGQLLGWEPQYTMRMGIEKLVEWYNANREWAKDILTP